MIGASRTIRLGGAEYRAPADEVAGGFATIDGARHARIGNVDRMAPFLMSIASDSDAWLFVGSNGPFTAGRRSPDEALFPYQTVDKLLRDPRTSGSRTILLVARDGETALWEPWQETSSVYRISRNLYKRVDGTAVLFEEVNHDLGVSFRWSLAATDTFGIVRRAELSELAGQAAAVRYLDGFHQLIPPGVGEDVYARLSYLASAYMRHERLPGLPLGIYTLNGAISDRPEPSEALQAATAWSVGHPHPVILLSDRQVAAFRRGEEVRDELEVRGELGAYLAVDEVELPAGGLHEWYTVGDTGLDQAAVLDTVALLEAPDRLRGILAEALEANSDGVRRRVAGADGLQLTADEAATANHISNVLFNVMRGGSFDAGYRVPLDDLAAYLLEQSRPVHARHEAWLASLPPNLTIHELWRMADDAGDPQLARLVRAYLPLTFGRRHGDPSRPWNRFSIRVRDATGRPVYGYQGNWRDLFQNWDALAQSYPDFLPSFVAVFLDASTADGYNPYRLTRSGIDWEVEDPRDPWSHIGYWGDHQLVYLLRLLDGLERHAPGSLSASLAERRYAYARVPYRISGLESMLVDPRSTIEFDRALHDELLAAADEIGADGKLMQDGRGEVRIVTLLEKLLVPLLVKLTNFVPGGGIWLNTQRPEWNDANNALVGWGLSVVTVSAVRRYLEFLDGLAAGDAEVEVSAPVGRLLERVTAILAGAGGPLDDAARYRVLTDLGRAGEEHRRAVYADELGIETRIPLASVRALVAAAAPVVEETLRASRRSDGLYQSYNLLRIDGPRATVDPLGPMLEGQVAILDSGLLTDREAVEVLRSLRASDLYRADQHSYLLYPDRELTPYLERNTLPGEPPIDDPSLFVRDRAGAWHFRADLSTIADVERRLEEAGADGPARTAVLDLWRDTFAHDEFTGRSGTFFMFEGLGSIYWHMVAKLLLAVQGCHRRATDPGAREALAEIYRDIRDGFGFRKTPATYGAFPTDAYSHTPSHRGAQQPGMTGQVKEQVLARLGELGVEVDAGRLTFNPSLLDRGELLGAAEELRWIDADGVDRSAGLPQGSLAFTICQVPVVYRLGAGATVELERADGETEALAGSVLPREASRAIFGRSGVYRRISVTLPEGVPSDD